MIKDLSKILAELEEGLQINEHALNEMLVQHPEFLYKVSKTLAITISDRDAAKKDLEDIEAEVDYELRHSAKVHDEKMTETEIKSNKRLDKRVDKAATDLQRLNHQVNLLSALKDSYQSRGYVLRDLVQLFIANYYSESSQDHAQKTLREERVDRARDKIAKRYRG